MQSVGNNNQKALGQFKLSLKCHIGISECQERAVMLTRIREKTWIGILPVKFFDNLLTGGKNEFKYQQISVFALKTNNATSGHAYKIQPSHCRVDVRKYFFAHKVIGPWNSLPANNEHFKSLSSFKAFLKHVDLIKFMACT